MNAAAAAAAVLAATNNLITGDNLTDIYKSLSRVVTTNNTAAATTNSVTYLPVVSNNERLMGFGNGVVSGTLTEVNQILNKFESRSANSSSPAPNNSSSSSMNSSTSRGKKVAANAATNSSIGSNKISSKNGSINKGYEYFN